MIVSPGIAPVARTHSFEDALAYLPRRKVIEYRQQEVIYDEDHPPTGLFLIVEGRVKVTMAMEGGAQTIMDILHSDEFFGEMAMLGGHTTHRERTTAMENAKLMFWSTEELEAQVVRHPKLGLALIQMLVGRCVDLKERLKSLACDRTPERVARELIRFAKSGTPQPDGTVFIPPLTHQVFAEYIGTSREIVTFHMNEFRRRGFLRYSRKGIAIFPEQLVEHLRNQTG